MDSVGLTMDSLGVGFVHVGDHHCGWGEDIDVEQREWRHVLQPDLYQDLADQMRAVPPGLLPRARQAPGAQIGHRPGAKTSRLGSTAPVARFPPKAHRR